MMLLRRKYVENSLSYTSKITMIMIPIMRLILIVPVAGKAMDVPVAVPLPSG